MVSGGGGVTQGGLGALPLLWQPAEPQDTEAPNALQDGQGYRPLPLPASN